MKPALCIQRDHAPLEVRAALTNGVKNLPADFFQTPVAIHDRAVCETDESLLQIIPYIVPYNEKDEIFTYYRGGAGEEARLHSMISCGAGGHVDVAPALGESLMEVLQKEARRELAEEFGITTERTFMFRGLLVDPTNEVGRVHLGLLTSFYIPSDRTMYLEKGMLEKGQWRTLYEMGHPNLYPRLENWSKAVVDHTIKNLNWYKEAA